MREEIETRPVALTLFTVASHDTHARLLALDNQTWAAWADAVGHAIAEADGQRWPLVNMLAPPPLPDAVLRSAQADVQWRAAVRKTGRLERRRAEIDAGVKRRVFAWGVGVGVVGVFAAAWLLQLVTT